MDEVPLCRDADPAATEDVGENDGEFLEQMLAEALEELMDDEDLPGDKIAIYK